jgi:FkbM family methyltransferase
MESDIAIDILDEDFVTLLYNIFLCRNPDAAGHAVHLSMLKSRKVSRSRLVANFALSQEFRRVNSLFSLEDFSVYTGYSASDLIIFQQFNTASVRPSQGFLTDFIGSRTRISSLWRGCEQFNNVVYPLPIPGDYQCSAIEWIGLLKGVLAAKDHFAAMELGAGHGPWIAAGAKAAELRGLHAITLCGVEADPGRFALMRQNIEDNELSAYEVTLIQAAIGTADGTARWPRTTNPAQQNGFRPLRYTAQGNGFSKADAAYLVGRHDDMIDIKVVSFGSLLQIRPLWDLVHMDIQGTEAELCRTFVDELSARVRYLVVGTHSRKIETDLLEVMAGGGWHLEHEQPCRFAFKQAAVIPEQMSTRDGTHVWRNPRL